MLLTGSFLRAVDEKHRIAIPKRLREALGDETPTALFIAPSTDGSLSLYTQRVFEELAARCADASPTAEDVRAFRRLFFARAQRVGIDRQYRIRIPPELAELADLRQEVILLGVHDHLELWDRKNWEVYLAKQAANYDQIAETAMSAEKTKPQE